MKNIIREREIRRSLSAGYKTKRRKVFRYAMESLLRSNQQGTETFTA
jgi:hypothetical protein